MFVVWFRVVEFLHCNAKLQTCSWWGSTAQSPPFMPGDETDIQRLGNAGMIRSDLCCSAVDATATAKTLIDTCTVRGGGAAAGCCEEGRERAEWMSIHEAPTGLPDMASTRDFPIWHHPLMHWAYYMY